MMLAARGGPLLHQLSLQLLHSHAMLIYTALFDSILDSIHDSILKE